MDTLVVNKLYKDYPLTTAYLMKGDKGFLTVKRLPDLIKEKFNIDVDIQDCPWWMPYNRRFYRTIRTMGYIEKKLGGNE
jgi:hypothetical protein